MLLQWREDDLQPDYRPSSRSLAVSPLARLPAPPGMATCTNEYRFVNIYIHLCIYISHVSLSLSIHVFDHQRRQIRQPKKMNIDILTYLSISWSVYQISYVYVSLAICVSIRQRRQIWQPRNEHRYITYSSTYLYANMTYISLSRYLRLYPPEPPGVKNHPVQKRFVPIFVCVLYQYPIFYCGLWLLKFWCYFILSFAIFTHI